MTFLGWAQIALYCLIIVALARPLGGYMTRLFAGERTLLSPVLGPIERGFYRAAGVDERSEQHWVTYGLAMLLFNGLGFLLLYALMRLQHFLPLNPQAMPAASEHLSFNTAVSFVTNTNWQSYGGESTLGYLVQMAGLTVQNFVSAATGIVLAVALVRGFTRASASTIGNFWADLVRCTLYLLLPLSIILRPVLRLAGRAAESRPLRRPPRPSKAASRRSPRDRSPRRSRSRCWAPTVAASSTPIRRIPTRTRRRSANFVQIMHDLRDRRRPHQPLRPHGRRRAPGLGDPGRHGRAVPGRRRGRLLGRGPCQPRPDRARRRRHGRQHGRQGGPLRHRRPRPCSR